MSLNTNPTPSDMMGIQSPKVLNTLRTIKAIQKRMKDPDVCNLEYVRVYDKLSREFNTFFESKTSIFIKVIRGESLDILAAALFYQDKVERGLITEEEVANMLANRFMTPEQRADAAAGIAKMKANGEI